MWDCLVLPETAPGDVRRALDLDAEAPLRLGFIPGPGDVVGSYRFWREGKFDPRVPVIAYSTMFYELADRLGAEAQVITPHPPPGDADAGITFVQIQRPDWSGRISYRRSQQTYADQSSAAIEAFDPHVLVVSTDFPPQSWPRIARGRRLILSAHNAFWLMGRPPSSPLARLRRLRLARDARVLDGAVCTSHECMRQVRTITKGRIEGLVECPQILARYDTTPKPRARRLLYLGRIEENKGIFLLLDAFAALAARYPDLSLIFAGDGTAEEALRGRIAALGMPQVDYLGRLPADEVHSAIAAADLVVCPTLTTFNEGLALVGFEAAAHGVPTVLSSIVPARDLLGAGCAVFEADSLPALCRTLEDLIENDGAYARLTAALGPVREKIYDRAGSWGSQLGQALLAKS